MAAAAPGLPRVRLTFAYDAGGRRIGKTKYMWSTASQTWTPQGVFTFVYDGWNLIAEFDSASPQAPLRSYVWGLDLSGTLQGAGGVGGLLWATTSEGTFAPAYDGNGNITTWVDVATGTKVAENDYDAFGNIIAIAGKNPAPFGFSTKYEDSETGILYYGYRFYKNSTGRWLSRDPIEENGGLNLYGIVGNSPVNLWDFLGMVDCEALRKHLDIVLRIYSNQLRNFGPGGEFADRVGLLDGLLLDNISNSNALTGLGLTALGLSIDARLAMDGAKGAYATNFYTGATPWQSQKVAIAGTAVGVVGIGIDVYQAADNFSSGDTLGGIKSTASGGLGGVGLAIASSNPGTAAAAGAVALAINAAEAGANAYLNHRSERWRIENAARAADLIKKAGQKIRELNEELIRGNCDDPCTVKFQMPK